MARVDSHDAMWDARDGEALSMDEMSGKKNEPQRWGDSGARVLCSRHDL